MDKGGFSVPFLVPGHVNTTMIKVVNLFVKTFKKFYDKKKKQNAFVQ